MRVARNPAKRYSAAPAHSTLVAPRGFTSFVPTTIPTNVTTVPPTVDIEFAMSRSWSATSEGIDEVAVVRKNRFSETTRSAGT